MLLQSIHSVQNIGCGSGLAQNYECDQTNHQAYAICFFHAMMTSTVEARNVRVAVKQSVLLIQEGADEENEFLDDVAFGIYENSPVWETLVSMTLTLR